MATPKVSGVPILAPDGKVYLVPAAQASEATMRGGKLVQRVQAPDGNQHWIPNDQMEEAQKHGGRIVKQDGTPYEKGTEPYVVGRNARGDAIWGAPPKEEQPGFLESAGTAVDNAAKGFVQMLDPRPSEEEKRAGKTGLVHDLLRYPERIVGPNLDQASEAGKALNEGRYSEAAGHGLASIVPLVGPWAAQVGEQAGQQAGEGNYSGAAGTVAGNALVGAAGEALPKAVGGTVRGAKAGTQFLKGKLADLQAPVADLNKPIAPGDLTPKERWEAANSMGVNLDRAQATNAPMPKIAKRMTEHSLMGNTVFDKNNAANVEALHAHANGILDSTAPAMPREEFGNLAKEKLGAHRAELKDEAGQLDSANALKDSIAPTEMGREEFGDNVKDAMAEHRMRLDDRVTQLYEGLDGRLGEIKPDISAIRDQAKGIYVKNKRFYDDHPELLKGGDARAWAIVKDFARDASKDPKAPRDNWSDLQRARSHLLDLTRSPEFIGDLATGWVKQLTGAIDGTMTSAEKTQGLKPQDIKEFRQANSIYKGMKETYDNPQSPFYWVSRQDGLKAANKLNELSPTEARQFRESMEQAGHPELINQQQRQAVSRMMDPAGNGQIDLAGFAKRWDKAPKEELGNIVEPAHMSALDDLAQRTKVETPYDRPGSKLAQVIDAPDGLAASKAMFTDSGALRLTPEDVRQLQEADPALLPHLQRQAMSRVFDPAGNGVADLKNLPSRWNRAQKESMQGVLTPEQIKNLDDIASVTKTVSLDSNPSGTAKVAQPAAEAAGAVGGLASGISTAVMGHPLAGAVTAAGVPAGMLAEQAIAKRMVDPKATAALMDRATPAAPAPATAPAATPGGKVATTFKTGLAASEGTKQDTAQETPAEVPETGRTVLAEGPEEVQLGNPVSGKTPAVPSAASVPDGATHEVLAPDGTTVLGHVVDGQYQPLKTETSQPEDNAASPQ